MNRFNVLRSVDELGREKWPGGGKNIFFKLSGGRDATITDYVTPGREDIVKIKSELMLIEKNSVFAGGEDWLLVTK